MMISTKGRYALRVMLDLAERGTSEYIPLRDIAKRQDISEKYLETILPTLIKNNLLEALRGKGGGYRLTREPESYTVDSILRLLEKNSLTPVACLECEQNKCERAAHCKTLPMWTELNRMISEYFDGITLADLCNNKEQINYNI